MMFWIAVSISVVAMIQNEHKKDHVRRIPNCYSKHKALALDYD